MIEKLRPMLELPWAYKMWNHLVGADRARRELATKYICPAQNDTILDIGCGSGNMVPYLHNSEYVGFDSNPDYIARAQRSFPRARFLCNRVSHQNLPASEYFDIVIAIGIVHHLDDAEASQLCRLAHHSLKEGGRLITFDGVWVAEQSSVAKFLLRRDRGKFIRSEQAYISLAAPFFSTIKATVRDDMLRIPYSHLILECKR